MTSAKKMSRWCTRKKTQERKRCLRADDEKEGGKPGLESAPNHSKKNGACNFAMRDLFPPWMVGDLVRDSHLKKTTKKMTRIENGGKGKAVGRKLSTGNGSVCETTNRVKTKKLKAIEAQFSIRRG